MSRIASASLDWHYRGMKTLILENQLIRMVVLVDKGSDVTELVYKPRGVDVLWHSPTGHRSPSGTGGLIGTPDSGFMDCYGGGWQDLLPTIGSGPVELHGATFGLHGETGVLPWKARVDDEEGETVRAVLSVKGRRYPYLLEKTITLREGESRIRISEKLTNTSEQDLEFYWLQHPSFGGRFLAPGCRLELPQGSRVICSEVNSRGRVADGESEWPIVTGRDGKVIDLSVIPSRDVIAEETTFIRVREGRYSLVNPTLRLGVELKWDVSVFPWVWFWQNYGVPDYPYFGKAWNVAVEPSTSLPTMMRRGTDTDAPLLKGGASLTTEIEVSLNPDE
ncbi:MAG: DUF4432 family protein [Thaumarchaeota archaeon]|nr:DUF4432 family protein [Nitrososphaerota archaeon]